MRLQEVGALISDLSMNAFFLIGSATTFFVIAFAITRMPRRSLAIGLCSTGFTGQLLIHISFAMRTPQRYSLDNISNVISFEFIGIPHLTLLLALFIIVIARSAMKNTDYRNSILYYASMFLLLLVNISSYAFIWALYGPKSID